MNVPRGLGLGVRSNIRSASWSPREPMMAVRLRPKCTGNRKANRGVMTIAETDLTSQVDDSLEGPAVIALQLPRLQRRCRDLRTRCKGDPGGVLTQNRLLGRVMGR